MKNVSIQEIADKYSVEYDKDNFNKKECIGNILLAMIDAGDFISKEDLTTTKIPYALVNFAYVDGEPDYVFIGLQGKSYYVPRGRDIPITHDMLNVVQRAVTTKLETSFDRTGQPQMRRVEVQTVPHAVVQMNYDMSKYLEAKE